MSEETIDQRAERLLERLEKLREDRGAMANLRRGFSPATEDRAWPWIGRWCDLANPWQRTIHTAVAAAYASHPLPTEDGNMGLVMRQIAQSNQEGENGLKTFAARFRRFLGCRTAEEVCQRLPGVIRAAAQRSIPVNYRQLFIDLCYWDRAPSRVKVRWAATYWSEEKGGS